MTHNEIRAFNSGVECRENARLAGNDEPVMFYDYRHQASVGTFEPSVEASQAFAKGWNGKNINASQD
jgi:hypothetical protein